MNTKINSNQSSQNTHEASRYNFDSRYINSINLFLIILGPSWITLIAFSHEAFISINFEVYFYSLQP